MTPSSPLDPSSCRRDGALGGARDSSAPIPIPGAKAAFRARCASAAVGQSRPQFSPPPYSPPQTGAHMEPPTLGLQYNTSSTLFEVGLRGGRAYLSNLSCLPEGRRRARGRGPKLARRRAAGAGRRAAVAR